MTVASRSFNELVSSFLGRKLVELQDKYGERDWRYTSVARQFNLHPHEQHHDNVHARLRHYDADMHFSDHEEAIKGMERLYRRTMLIELTTSCFAHCRWCLRSNYQRFTLSKEQIRYNVGLLSAPAAVDTVREILITGGDPLVSAQMLDFTLSELAERAPQIEIVRIGSRVFTSNPEHIDDDIVEMFAKHRKNFRLEIGTHINSPMEFWPESVEAMRKLQDIGMVIYNQHPLLKGVNDDVGVLAELYDNCRRYGIESHYLFHCVPMVGMEHHRTSVAKGLELVRKLTAGGLFSGRSKPHYACMTDIGKVVLYQGTVLEKNEESNEILLRSGYKLEDRLRYNPGFRLTDSAFADEDGFLCVWYPDGIDDGFWEHEGR